MSDGRSRIRGALVAGATRLGVEGRLRQVKRGFEPAATTRDRRDHESLRVVLAAVLGETSSAIDVGANEGGVLADVVRLAPGGRHLAFEPLPHLARALAAAYPTVDVRELALSDGARAAEFVHVVTRPGWSGFRERPYPGDERLERLTVQTAALDDVLPAGLVPALVKIDVEGAELEVLRGARRTLREHRPVVLLEHGLGSADHYGTGPADVHAELTQAGLRVFDLDGDGPYDLARFERAFRTGERVNFLARP